MMVGHGRLGSEAEEVVDIQGGLQHLLDATVLSPENQPVRNFVDESAEVTKSELFLDLFLVLAVDPEKSSDSRNRVVEGIGEGYQHDWFGGGRIVDVPHWNDCCRVNPVLGEIVSPTSESTMVDLPVLMRPMKMRATELSHTLNIWW